MNQTPSTCPAPSTASPASTSLLHADDDASGRPIPADARCEHCRQVGNGCSLARCRNPPPRRAAQPATPAPVVDNRREITATCTCDRRYKGDRWAPPSVSELSAPGVADQDIADAVGIARCRLRSLQVMVERDGLDEIQATAQGGPAQRYIDNAEKHLLAPRNIRVTVEHVL